MSAYKYNAEHYHDPTANIALSKMDREDAVAKYTSMVFVSSPFAGDVKTNVRNARKYARFTMKQGMIPVPPHLLFPQILNDNNPSERALGMRFGMALLRHCDELWVFGDRLSPGMSAELEAAKRMRKRIRYFNSDCKEVSL